jgi:hypothetical protein
VILHWLLVGSIVVATATGLRIATESPRHPWLAQYAWLLPERFVWTAHIASALLLVAAAVGYASYMFNSGLLQRVKLDRSRLAALLSSKSSRWTTTNIVLYWILYAAMLLQMLTGAALYFDLAGSGACFLHWVAMCVILGYAALHVACHALMGGGAQLVRIFKFGALRPPAPAFDPFEVIAAIEQKYALAPSQAGGPGGRSGAGGHPPPDVGNRGNPRRALSRAVNPLLLSAAVTALAVASIAAWDRTSIEVLHIRRIDPSQAPKVDGDASDPVWTTISSVNVRTDNGANLGGTGDSTIGIKAVHDGQRAYFLCVWDDPTRSLKQTPLEKRNGAWHLLAPANSSERRFNQDKFSILLTKLDSVLAGDHTFHAGNPPQAEKLRTLSGQGLHYTTAADVYADVWEWKATSTNPSGMLDDDHFGPPTKATEAQASGAAPYRGGFAPDSGTANYSWNYVTPLPHTDDPTVTPRRLPKDLAAVARQIGHVDLDPEHSDDEGSRWYMTEKETEPYSADRDHNIPDGTVIPGIIISGQYAGDRADVMGAARWAANRWILEVTRPLRPNTKFDVAIETGTFMRVAVFDHDRFKHTRHIRPLRLEVD